MASVVAPACRPGHVSDTEGRGQIMANWLRILLIVVAVLVGVINLAIVCIAVAVQFSPREEITEARATYTLGSTTFGRDESTVESEMRGVLDEAGIDATVRATYPGTADEGWWVDIELLNVESEDQAHLAEFRLSQTMMVRFPEAVQRGFTVSWPGWFSALAIWGALGFATANLLVAVIAAGLLLKYKRPLKSHLPTRQSPSPVQTDAGR